MAAAAQTTIIKRVVEDDHDGHHGGAWKVAYADFMTAMMAFFLLLWIVSSSDEQQLRGIAEYFTDATEPGGLGVLDGASLGPPGTLMGSNGAILARGSELGEENQTVTARWEVRDVTPSEEPQPEAAATTARQSIFESSGAAPQMFDADASEGETEALSGAGAFSESGAAAELGQSPTSVGAGTGGAAEADRAADQERFTQLQSDLMQAIQENPDLRPLEENVVFEQTERGLRIQIIDQDGKAMFASGSADMPEATQLLMQKLGESLATLPNQMVITGHTDAVPFTSRDNYDNWDLSTDRANAMRRVLLSSGVSKDRLTSVSGKAYTEPLVPERPEDPSNRRVAVFLQYEAPAAQIEEARATDEAVPQTPDTSAPIEAVSQDATTILDERTLESLRSVLR